MMLRSVVRYRLAPLFLLFFLSSQLPLAAVGETVSVNGRSYSISVPPAMCEASDTLWGRAYRNFLTKLGIGAGGDPQILLVLSDCVFLATEAPSKPPQTWGYLAYDANMGKYWFGQRRLDSRLRKSLAAGMEDGRAAGEIRRITEASLAKMKSRLKIGEMLPLGDPVETDFGFLASALSRLEAGDARMDVFLVTVTFMRNREVLTLTLYRAANTAGSLEEIEASARTFLLSLEE